MLAFGLVRAPSGVLPAGIGHAGPGRGPGATVGATSNVARTVRTAYACTECGAASPRWVGRCPACGAWNSLVEEVLERTAPARASGPVTAPVPITEVAAQDPVELLDPGGAVGPGLGGDLGDRDRRADRPGRPGRGGPLQHLLDQAVPGATG